MRIFDHPNMVNFVCPICGKADDKPVCLIPIWGTNSAESRLTFEARQYHIECIDLCEYEINGKVLINQVVKHPELNEESNLLDKINRLNEKTGKLEKYLKHGRW